MKWKIWKKKPSTILIPGHQTPVLQKIDKKEKCSHPNENKSLKNTIKTWNECNTNGHHLKIKDFNSYFTDKNDKTNLTCTICGVGIKVNVNGSSIQIYPELPEIYFMDKSAEGGI